MEGLHHEGEKETGRETRGIQRPGALIRSASRQKESRTNKKIWGASALKTPKVRYIRKAERKKKDQLKSRLSKEWVSGKREGQGGERATKTSGEEVNASASSCTIKEQEPEKKNGEGLKVSPHRSIERSS